MSDIEHTAKPHVLILTGTLTQIKGFIEVHMLQQHHFPNPSGEFNPLGMYELRGPISPPGVVSETSLCWLIISGFNMVLDQVDRGHSSGVGGSWGGVTFDPYMTLADMAHEVQKHNKRLSEVLGLGELCVTEIPHGKIRLVFHQARDSNSPIAQQWLSALTIEMKNHGFEISTASHLVRRNSQMSNIEEIESLLNQGQDIQETMAQIQLGENTGLSPDQIRLIREQYQDWYGKAITLLPEKLRVAFEKEYQGNLFINKIKNFLSDPNKPGAIHMFYQTQSKPRPAAYSYWQYPYQQTFAAPFMEQQSILRQARELYRQEERSHDTPEKGNNSNESAMINNLAQTIAASPLEEQLKNVILYDLEQAHIAYKAEAFKACVVMLGAALEGLMLATLRQDAVLKIMQADANLPNDIWKKLSGQKSPKNALLSDFANQIAKILTFDDYRVLLLQYLPSTDQLKIEGIQSFRNAVHPWKTAESPSVFGEFDRARAMHHLSSLMILTQHILAWKPQSNTLSA